MSDDLLRRRVLDTMAPVIARCLPAKDTTHPVFHGCVDWHSSVHGHWALFRTDRVTGAHAREADLADRSLEPEGLAKEMRDLARDPSFEMPYGRAWFLLLAEEHAGWAAKTEGRDAAKLRPLADAIADSLVAFYSGEAPDVATREYDNASWALLRMHRWFAHTGDEARRKKVEGWIAGLRGLEGADEGFAFDRGHTDFFSRFGNFATAVVKTQDRPAIEGFLRRHPIRDEDLRPLVEVGRAAHHLGTNWSRAWAFAALADAAPEEADRTRFHAAWRAHVEQGLKQHVLSVGDVWSYDHWVPQFAVYAVTGK